MRLPLQIQKRLWKEFFDQKDYLILLPYHQLWMRNVQRTRRPQTSVGGIFTHDLPDWKDNRNLRAGTQDMTQSCYEVEWVVTARLPVLRIIVRALWSTCQPCNISFGPYHGHNIWASWSAEHTKTHWQQRAPNGSTGTYGWFIQNWTYSILELIGEGNMQTFLGTVLPQSMAKSVDMVTIVLSTSNKKRLFTWR